MPYSSFFDRLEAPPNLWLLKPMGPRFWGLHVMAHVATNQPKKRGFFPIPEVGVCARRILYYARQNISTRNYLGQGVKQYRMDEFLPLLRLLVLEVLQHEPRCAIDSFTRTSKPMVKVPAFE